MAPEAHVIGRLSASGRIAWRDMTRDEIIAIILYADRHGQLSLLKAARAALRRRDGLGR